jgi:hypothetical protein
LHLFQGFNSADELCRAVVLIGQPNLNWEDPAMIIKEVLIGKEKFMAFYVR